MSTWEERMAVRAAERRCADEEMHQALDGAARQAEAKQAARECLKDFKAGPPGGCRECYSWQQSFPGWGPGWGHGCSVRPGVPPDLPYAPPGVPGDYVQKDEDWCYHACHGGRPVYCGPVVIG